MENMRNMRILLGISVSILLIISQISQVSAANNQGLEWGVAIDDSFDFTITATYHNYTLDLDIDNGMYVEIDILPTIPDDVTGLHELTLLTFSTFWDNGTSMDDFWQDIMMIVPFYVLPIGNWSLIETLYESTVITQDATIFTATSTPSATYNATLTVLKSDGALAHLKMDWIRSTDSLSFEIIREGYDVHTTTTTTTTTTATTTSTTSTTSNTTSTTSQTGDSTLWLVVGGGAAVAGIILALVVLQRR